MIRWAIGVQTYIHHHYHHLWYQITCFQNLRLFVSPPIIMFSFLLNLFPSKLVFLDLFDDWFVRYWIFSMNSSSAESCISHCSKIICLTDQKFPQLSWLTNLLNSMFDGDKYAERQWTFGRSLYGINCYISHIDRIFSIDDNWFVIPRAATYINVEIFDKKTWYFSRLSCDWVEWNW